MLVKNQSGEVSGLSWSHGMAPGEILSPVSEVIYWACPRMTHAEGAAVPSFYQASMWGKSQVMADLEAFSPPL